MAKNDVAKKSNETGHDEKTMVSLTIKVLPADANFFKEVFAKRYDTQGEAFNDLVSGGLEKIKREEIGSTDFQPLVDEWDGHCSQMLNLLKKASDLYDSAVVKAKANVESEMERLQMTFAAVTNELGSVKETLKNAEKAYQDEKDKNERLAEEIRIKDDRIKQLEDDKKFMKETVEKATRSFEEMAKSVSAKQEGSGGENDETGKSEVLR